MPPKKRTKTKNKRGLVSTIALALFSLFTVGVAAGVIYVALLIRTLPTPEQFQFHQTSQSTKIYDRTGKVLLYEIHGEQKRTVIPFSEIPTYLKEATIAIEDANFYTRPAIDWEGILRSLWADIRAGAPVQGGSTITQQLAKNIFLSSQKTISRKVKEMILAVELEAKYSKDQILDFYLNQIPYGSNAYGVEAASQTYFGKPAKDLDLAESAIIASLPQAPTYYSPWGDHVSDLLTRQHYVLDRMAQQGYITQAEADQAKSEKLNFTPPSLGTIKAPHFVMAVKDYLVNKYGEDMVVNGGLKVITTLNWDMQQAAESAVETGVERNTKLYDSKNAALVAEDPTTGQILALVGSANYFDQSIDGNFDMPLQGLRQPGSSLKPFVYLQALEDGYPPNTVVWDVPTEFVPGNPICTAIPDFNNTDADYKKSCFHPQDFENFQGPVTFEQALPESINVAAVKVLYLVGLQNALSKLQSFGITTLNDPSRYGLSLVLGGGEVKLIDLLKAYSILSQEGVEHNQTMVLEVDDANGNALEKYQDQSARVDAPTYIRWINYILSNPAFRQPLFQASFNKTVFPGYDVALKTGTTNDYRDAWAFGYTPALAVGVWAGNSDNTPMQHSGTSILAAVPIWSDFLNKVLPNYPQESFTPPDPLPPNTKPMLNGQYINNGSIHSILYYVDKNDPAGPVPANPMNDPQFTDWEAGVLDWVSKNMPD
ncbi:penicillin-binding protein [Patescibacteria group bacterium]|nr:penicillin-binding protein [Patescibacteria group bacterium]